jgi:hypothetical protein
MAIIVHVVPSFFGNNNDRTLGVTSHDVAMECNFFFFFLPCFGTVHKQTAAHKYGSDDENYIPTPPTKYLVQPDRNTWGTTTQQPTLHVLMYPPTTQVN